MLGSHRSESWPSSMLIVAIVLQTGATTATKAIKFSAKLITGSSPVLSQPTPKRSATGDPDPAAPTATATVAAEER
jgi:hypothetical protein